MAELSCQSCEDIKQEVPSLVTNGLSSTMCTSLKNDTGLKASSGNDDCEDLNNLNDCLVGNMETEIDKYDVCEWKPFTKMLIGNVWTTLKAMICAICGLWTNVHNLWTALRSLCLKKEGNKIVLYSNLGDHCSVTDSDTTYDLTKSGNKIVLTGSDGSRDEVTDSDTTYQLTKSGNTIHLKGSDGSDDSVTAPDTDTWKPNTSSQEGYVKKGGDDPLSVWATNASGVPDWRSSVTLDGNLTLQNHSSPIGATKFWGLDSSMSIANDTPRMIQAGFTLDKGVWVVVCTIGYSGNSNGSRSVGLSFGNAGHHNGMSVAPAPSNRVTILTKTYIRVCDTDGEKVYLDAYQDSGQALNLTTNPDTYVYAVRIR